MPSCDFNNFDCTCAGCTAWNNRDTKDEAPTKIVVEPNPYADLSTEQKWLYPPSNEPPKPVMKTCKDCNQTLERESNFYKGGKYNLSWQARCKSCHNSNRMSYALAKKVYVKKGRGWDSYPKEKKADIKQMFEQKIKAKDIAIKYSVSHPTVYKWKKIINKDTEV